MTEILTTSTLITGPTMEPIDLDEVKKQLRFTSSSEDTLIDTWISAARQHFEEQTGRQCLTATWEYWLSGFPVQAVIELPHPPLQSVVSVSYDDDTGTETVIDPTTYLVSAPSGPTCRRGRVGLLPAGVWPTITTVKADAVRIRYLAGYGSAPVAVPELVKTALYALVAHFHAHRSEVQEQSASLLPFGAQAILTAFKYSALPSSLPVSR